MGETFFLKKLFYLFSSYCPLQTDNVKTFSDLNCNASNSNNTYVCHWHKHLNVLEQTEK